MLIDKQTDCISAGGTTDGVFDGIDYGTETSGLAICPGECPSAGHIEGFWQGERDEKRVTIDFDGSSVAKVVGWSGREFDVQMVCEPATL